MYKLRSASVLRAGGWDNVSAAQLQAMGHMAEARAIGARSLDFFSPEGKTEICVFYVKYGVFKHGLV